MKKWLMMALVVLAAPGTASASLIDLGQVTRDTQLNGGLALEWLDMGVTRGRSFVDVAADAGLAAQGWRYATATEVLTLITHTGYPSVPPPTGPDGLPSDDPLVYAGMLTFLQLIDAHIFIGLPVGAEQLRADANAITADVTNPAAGIHRTIYAMAWDLNPLAYGGREQTSRVFVGQQSGTFAADAFLQNQSWLVRETAVAAVPEPSTCVLIATGLVVAMLRRRLRQ